MLTSALCSPTAPLGPLAPISIHGHASNNEQLPCSAAQACLAAVRKQFWAWTREWGSIDFFEFHIVDSYQRAIEDSGPNFSLWVSKIRSKLNRGRSILEKLKEVLTLELPLDRDRVEDLWRQAFELAAQLHRGLALLEVWLELTEEED